MKKQLLILLLAFLTSLSASAYDFCVDGIYYNINGSEASVTYKDHNYNSYTGSVTIPASVTYNGTNYSVTSIGIAAFSSCSGLTSVTIPNSVTSIGTRAFEGCSSLSSVTIPNSVTSIGTMVFSGTALYNDDSNWVNNVLYIGNHLIKAKRELTGTYTINEGTLTIAEQAFYCCSGLTAVTIPNSVTSIDFGTFNGCSGLTSVTIPNSVTSIGGLAFFGCSSLASVTIPDSVNSIGYGAFSNCSGLKAFYGKYASSDNRCLIVDETLNFFAPYGLSTYSIPESVTSIGIEAFNGCSGLTSVTIPDSVTKIGGLAFVGCSGLTSVTIPNSVTSIEYSAFSGCTALESVKVYNKNPDNITLGESVFMDVPVDTCVLYVPEGSKSLYAAADQWSDFTNIEEFPYSGLEAIEAEAAAGDGFYYDLSGRRVMNPSRGIYIHNGKKVLVK